MRALKVKVILTPSERRICGTCGQLIDGEQLRFFAPLTAEGRQVALYVHPWCSRQTRAHLGEEKRR